MGQKLDACPHIVEAITAMSQKLGIENIAEGVETAEQLQILQNQGCNE